jgi:ABC-type multidrug transport system permease subunit
MWLLSGAFFPAGGAALWVQVVMWVNPLSYGLGALRRVLYPAAVADQLGDPALLTSLLVLLGFTVVLLALAVRAARRATRR